MELDQLRSVFPKIKLSFNKWMSMTIQMEIFQKESQRSEPSRFDINKSALSIDLQGMCTKATQEAIWWLVSASMGQLLEDPDSGSIQHSIFFFSLRKNLSGQRPFEVALLSPCFTHWPLISQELHFNRPRLRREMIPVTSPWGDRSLWHVIKLPGCSP